MECYSCYWEKLVLSGCFHRLVFLRMLDSGICPGVRRERDHDVRHGRQDLRAGLAFHVVRKRRPRAFLDDPWIPLLPSSLSLAVPELSCYLVSPIRSVRVVDHPEALKYWTTCKHYRSSIQSTHPKFGDRNSCKPKLERRIVQKL